MTCHLGVVMGVGREEGTSDEIERGVKRMGKVDDSTNGKKRKIVNRKSWKYHI